MMRVTAAWHVIDPDRYERGYLYVHVVEPLFLVNRNPQLNTSMTQNLKNRKKSVETIVKSCQSS